MYLLANRYKLERQLGKKAGRQTFLARDSQTQNLVVIKLLSFGNEFEWDDLKLFEREAATLQELSHPAIPQYLDYFEVDEPARKGFAIAQTYIDAPSLEQHLQAGRTFSEADIKQLAHNLLEILTYLHQRQPSVIHRDLKPSNILLGDRSGTSPGQVYLVDFGSVQTCVAKDIGTRTIVGTYGYMPPEQFGGRVGAASDIYSLGATLICLVTGQHPADLPQDDLRIEFESLVNLSPSFVAWLRQMTEPSLKKRFSTAEAALKALHTPPVPIASDGHHAKVIPHQPAGSRVRISKLNQAIEVVILPNGFQWASVFLAPFAIAWNSFIFFWTLSAFFIPFPINIPFLLFSLPFWSAGIAMALSALFPVFGSVRLRIDQHNISLTWEMFGLKCSRPRDDQRQNIYKLVYVPKHFVKDSDGDRIHKPASLEIRTNRREYQLTGRHGGIGIATEAELEWIAHELSEWLDMPIERG
ncbi:serine/threonine protein kinase [Myxacorys almedinensis]|uniref:Protein kinase n=1 Tax=Myxacorys almedinensis A TaxID=2690445 RepID=A0A8J7YWC9_9CYAN|nr:serine/threonine-protein kinase [Myxacorys almedinensis]NDJ15882.1 protein kinase [Myxacorys almedinensis A]